MSDERVIRFRSFNRKWTEILGLLDQGLLQTEHSLPEARVLFELAQQPVWERVELRTYLGMDASFLSRVVGGLADKGLVEVAPSDADGRAVTLALTPEGRAVASELDGRSSGQIIELLETMSPGQVDDVVEAMTVIANLVEPGHSDGVVTYRGLQPGDLGWVVQRHGAVYADEYGWGRGFEGLVAKIVTDFHEGFKPGREDAWIAEVDGARVGCVFCFEKDEQTAQLRILLVERWARGWGIGSGLVDRCLEFARTAGYSKMMLWTNSVLNEARQIYVRRGFELVEEETHDTFGVELVGQSWELDL